MQQSTEKSWRTIYFNLEENRGFRDHLFSGTKTIRSIQLKIRQKWFGDNEVDVLEGRSECFL